MVLLMVWSGAMEGTRAEGTAGAASADRPPTSPAEPTAPAGKLPPIRTVEVRGRALVVNGRPFFPLMAWLQDASNFPALRACGINTVAGYWPRSSGTRDVAEYLPMVWKAGFYGVMPFEERLRGHPGLLGYIHQDEPDLPHPVSDAEVTPGPGLRLNRSAPLWKVVDGVWHSWSVLDPLQGASFTIHLDRPATAVRLAVYVTVSEGLAVAKDVVFEADGRPVLEATLEPVKGRQAFDLPRPVTFRRLGFRVRTTYPGTRAWGSVGEVEAYDAAGRNVLVRPPRLEPRARPEETLAVYRRIRARDPTRPVFMTLTGYFHPHFGKWPEARRRRLYPAYVEAADVVGFDIYPIYGWNRPDWIHLVHEATARLTALAGPRPVYAWIETSRGGQYTGPLERQKAVTPRHIRAEVWMAVCGGATAIGYFTHVWKPSYRQFGVPEENRRALAEINAQLTRLAPAVLGPPAEGGMAATDPEARVAALFRRLGGRLYVFAVNYDPRGRAATVDFTVPGLAEGSAVEVVDEGRRLRARAGGFRDRFEPLAVHIYRAEVSAARTQD